VIVSISTLVKADTPLVEVHCKNLFQCFGACFLSPPDYIFSFLLCTVILIQEQEINNVITHIKVVIIITPKRMDNIITHIKAIVIILFFVVRTGFEPVSTP
jgi:hypothetical protein